MSKVRDVAITVLVTFLVTLAVGTLADYVMGPRGRIVTGPPVRLDGRLFLPIDLHNHGSRSLNGVRIAILDTGVNEDHHDFWTINADGEPGVTRLYQSYPPGDCACPPSASDVDCWLNGPHGYHGTHVAGIAAASGLRSGSSPDFEPFELRGVAPEAEVGAYEAYTYPAPGVPITTAGIWKPKILEPVPHQPVRVRSSAWSRKNL